MLNCTDLLKFQIALFAKFLSVQYSEVQPHQMIPTKIILMEPLVEFFTQNTKMEMVNE